MEHHEVVVRIPGGQFESNAGAAGFIYAALTEALQRADKDNSYCPVAVVWKDPGEPWRLFTDGGAEEVEKGLVFSE